MFVCPPLPQDSYVVVLIPNVAEFGDGALMEVIQVKWGHEDGALILYD